MPSVMAPFVAYNAQELVHPLIQKPSKGQPLWKRDFG